MRSRPPFRLLVFDWDGTLVDSIASIVACTLAGLEDLGLQPPPVEEIRAAVGLNREESLDRLFPDSGAAERERVVERIRHHWLATYRHRVPLIDGAAAAIGSLAEAEYLLAVATGKSRAGLDHDLEATGLAGAFIATRTADEAASKPHPQMLHELMDELGAAPAETLMIGDTTFDLEMAAGAGCDALGVLSGSHGRAELEACAPLDVIASVGAVPPWLERRRA